MVNTITFAGLLYVLIVVRTAVRAAFIIAVGPARVYAGAHWPSDVLGGYLIGAVLLVVIVRFYRTRVSGGGEVGRVVEYRGDG
ncbi:MAG: phosphatase PAP2 family protein [Dehalococcoidia bacterium]|nr:phosphatase PAP2 family protein [Dehalococcoidia bacterium]